MQNINDIVLWKNSYGLLPIKHFSGNKHKGKFIFVGDAAGKQRHTSANISDYLQGIELMKFLIFLGSSY